MITWGDCVKWFISLNLLLFSVSAAFANYHLAELTSSDWNGTVADRLQAEAVGQYQFNYGEEEVVEFSLPWAFSFYNGSYNQLTADSDGNIWFGAVDSGPRIAVWKTDLNSYYSGGTFVEHKTSPERIVVQWQTEVADQAGYGRSNNIEAVLYPDGTIALNYQTISPDAFSDLGSGITDGTAWLTLPVSVTTLQNRSFVFSINDDTDGDGIDDLVDNCPLTPNNDQSDFDADGMGNVCDADDDNDGMPDAYEESYTFLDPRDPTDASEDYDQDGLTNIQEHNFGSSPVESDSDFNGVSDLSEWISTNIMPIINSHMLNN